MLLIGIGIWARVCLPGFTRTWVEKRWGQQQAAKNPLLSIIPSIYGFRHNDFAHSSHIRPAYMWVFRRTISLIKPFPPVREREACRGNKRRSKPVFPFSPGWFPGADKDCATSGPRRAIRRPVGWRACEGHISSLCPCCFSAVP